MMAQWQTQLDLIRHDHRTPFFITALLGIGIALIGWQLTQTLITPTHTANHPTTALEKPLQSTADLHLFGVYATNLSALPATTLQFTLEGTVVFLDTPTQSRALIAAQNAPAKVYKIGDTLPGNATITRITKDYVVLNDNGTLEKLTLPIPSLLKATP
jgi:general secretion pathway protein C